MMTDYLCMGELVFFFKLIFILFFCIVLFAFTYCLTSILGYVVLCLQSLIYFAGAVPSATEDFLLTSPSPLLHLRSQQTGTPRECGLLESTTIFIHWTPAGQVI